MIVTDYAAVCKYVITKQCTEAMNHYIYKRYYRIALAALLLTAFAAANIGCTPFDYYDPTLEQPAPADTAIPSE